MLFRSIEPHLCGITGIQTLPVSEFTLYPIPNEGRFTVSIATQTVENICIVVYNSLGFKVLVMNDIEVNGTVEKVIDLRPLPEGMYFVVFESSVTKVITRITVTK
jgi:hypothetical protein